MPSLTTIGDEPLEARIVAWVLGDASAFEEAELERLCAERPELLVFRRRMRALHGLLTEAEAAQPDPTWKLPPEKRMVLDELFGAPVRLTNKPTPARKRRSTWNWTLSALAACLIALLVIGAMFSMKGIGHSGKIITAMGKADQKEETSERTVHYSLAYEPQAAAEGEKKPDNSPAPESDMFFARRTASDRAPAGPPAPAKPSAPASAMDREILARADSTAEMTPAPPAAVPLGATGYLFDTDTAKAETPAPAAGPVAGADIRFSGGVGGGAGAIPGQRPISGQPIAGQPAPPVPSDLAANIPTTNDLPVAGKVFTGALEIDRPAAPGESDFNMVDALTKRQPAAKEDVEASYGFAVTRSGSDRFSTTPPPSLSTSRVETATTTRWLGRTVVRDTAAPQSTATVAGAKTATITGTTIVGGGALGLDSTSTLNLEAASKQAETSSQLPSLSNNRSWHWHSQDEDTKGKANLSDGSTVVLDGGLLTETASGGLKTDLSKSLAERETVRRQESVAEADHLLVAGREDYQNGRFGEAHAKFKSAGEKLPDAPLTEDRKKAIAAHEATAATALAQKALSANTPESKDQARKLLEDALASDPANPYAKKELEAIDDPIRSNPSLSQDHGNDVANVRRGLYTAEGAFNLGKYDQAKQEYEKVLRADPNNAAARQGLETIANAKSQYYRAAYDQTRAELLMEVDGTVEMSLPPDAESLEKAALDQEQKVEESRKRLTEIVRTKGIIYHDHNSAGQAGLEDEHGARAAQDNYIALETEKTQLDGMIKTLLKYDNDELAAYAAGLILPDNAVRPLYPKYIEAKSQLEAFKQEGRGEQHPGYQAKKQEVEALRKQLDEGTVALRDTLQAKLDLANARWERAKVARAEKKGETIKSSVDRQDYEEAKSVFEAESAKLAALKAKLASVPPKPAPPVPSDELSAEAEPYSTFSLSVSDASFKTAHAALMQNNIPDPAGIRVEQFYNAMDYGDPYPTKGEPVAAAIEQAAHPVIPGRNLVRVALRTAAVGRAASQPLCLTLLIDQSGSMARDDRRQALTRALAELATLLTPADRVTVIGFSLSPRMLADRLPGDQASKLADLVNLDANEGGTNLERALVLGKDVAEARKIEGAQNRIVLFTDGAANLGNADPARLAETIRQVRQRGLAFDVAGLGTSELNDRLLAELARHGNGRFHVVDAAADAPDSFAKQLAGAFRPAAENVKVQVRFNPRRVGGYKLLGFEEHRLKREDFHNDAVDAAELAAAEAGIALYQIEPLPNGTGDIGEMSVRFRDTATGNMVERSWSIPYDSNAPAFDRANPPLQLAGLAMLAAEKLRGGPLAAATDFTALTPSRTTIRQFYPQQRRAADLLDMIDRIR